MIHFSLILSSAVASTAVLLVLHFVTPLEIMLIGVQAHITFTETQQDSTNLNSVLDYELLVNMVINTSKQCQKSATHLSRHKKLASIICVMLLTEDNVVLTR